MEDIRGSRKLLRMVVAGATVTAIIAVEFYGPGVSVSAKKGGKPNEARPPWLVTIDTSGLFADDGFLVDGCCSEGIMDTTAIGTGSDALHVQWPFDAMILTPCDQTLAPPIVLTYAPFLAVQTDEFGLPFAVSIRIDELDSKKSQRYQTDWIPVAVVGNPDDGDFALVADTCGIPIYPQSGKNRGIPVGTVAFPTFQYVRNPASQ